MSHKLGKITKQKGSVVGVVHDMILVRYGGGSSEKKSSGVLFYKHLLTRSYKHDDIVEFSARPATTTDKEVGDRLVQLSRYEINYVGTEIKYIKAARWMRGEGEVVAIPNENDSQFMFVDWRFTSNPPSVCNVFATRATVRPEVKSLRSMFRTGQRVKFIAKEQANEGNWRAVIITDEHHDIEQDSASGAHRNTYRVVEKASRGAPPPAAASESIFKQRPLVAPPKPATTSSTSSTSSTPKTATSFTSSSTPKPATMTMGSLQKALPTNVDDGFQVQKPPPVDGYDYFDTSREACDARFRHFAALYRESNPDCMFSDVKFEGFLKIKYLQQVNEELTAIRAAQRSC